jgi:transcriptional regulator with XRE-family HTH domain
MIRNQLLFWENVEKVLLYRTAKSTAEVLSLLTGVPASTIARIKHGEASTKLSTAEQIADGLGIELWKLFVPFFDPANEPTAFTKQQELELNQIKRLLGKLS